MRLSCSTCNNYSPRDRWCSAFEEYVLNPGFGTCRAHSERAAETECLECGATIDGGDLCWDCTMNGPDNEAEDGGDEDLVTPI